MADRVASPTRDFGILILRLGLGAAFVVHGWPKLKGGPEGWHQIGMAAGAVGLHFAPTFWGFCAAVAEFFGGLCLIVGLLVRPIAIILLFDMVVAITFHLSIPGNTAVEQTLKSFNTGWSHPLENAIVFLALAFIGPGAYSVDARLFARNRHRLPPGRDATDYIAPTPRPAP